MASTEGTQLTQAEEEKVRVGDRVRAEAANMEVRTFVNTTEGSRIYRHRTPRPTRFDSPKRFLFGTVITKSAAPKPGAELICTVRWDSKDSRQRMSVVPVVLLSPTPQKVRRS